MLQPREADLPALLLFLVVLPLVTYILLGIWSETVKKKARISMLAQRAAEEAYRVEAMTSADVIPTGLSSGTGFPACARCFAPATTRCSRCKSVRYCSGKCQIIHWRQGHKQECHQWKEIPFVSAYPTFQETVPEKPLVDNLKSPINGTHMEEPLYCDILREQSDSPSLMMPHLSQNSEAGREQSDNPKFRRFESKIDDCGPPFDEKSSHSADTHSPSSTLFAEMSPDDVSMGYKSGIGNFKSPDKIRRNEDTCYPSSANSLTHWSHKSTGEIRKGMKQSGSTTTLTLSDLDKHVTKEYENSANITSTESELHQTGFSSNNETAGISYSAPSNAAKGSTTYKKPPYTLGHATSLPQKSRENISREIPCQETEQSVYKENGSRVPQMNISTNTCLQQRKENSNIEGKLAGSKKTSKFLKRNLVGLISDNKKNKICHMLFPYEDLVKLFQCEVWEISPRGLINCGNSCYANAVLQCLACTKPLMVYLLRGLHSRTCFSKDWCLICELEHYVSMLREGGGPLSPSRILSNMRNIGCRMGGGNQEDAHEFLRLLVMSMQSICLEGLGGEKEIHPSLQETTLIQQIFGGRLKSKVMCLNCHLESERYESIMDLTLEIHGWVESLEDALTQFTAPEDLDGENMYRCGRCSAYVKARKQLSLHEVPNILTIVLKRFQTGKYGKINKCVTFPDMLDMIPFVTGTADNPPLYLLYAVVVHLDTLNASFSGHYISYVKDLQGSWFRIDDSEVQAVPLSQVMSEGAYMLFYSRSFPRPPRAYIGKVPLQVSVNGKRSAPKTQKPSKHEQQPETSYDTELHLRNNLKAKYGDHIDDQAAGCNVRSSSANFIPSEGTYSDSLSMDFSDATSSDWSLFTSSDESSFTESTRNSFSTVDYGDNASLDALSSIFSSPFYVPEYSQSNTISCTKFSPCRPQTRFFSESTGAVLDPSVPMQPLGNVYRGRNLAHLRASSVEPASNYNSYGRYRCDRKDGFDQASGFCSM